MVNRRFEVHNNIIHCLLPTLSFSHKQVICMGGQKPLSMVWWNEVVWHCMYFRGLQRPCETEAVGGEVDVKLLRPPLEHWLFLGKAICSYYPFYGRFCSNNHAFTPTLICFTQNWNEREREGDGFNEKVLQKIAMRDFMMLHKEEINAWKQVWGGPDFDW